MTTEDLKFTPQDLNAIDLADDLKISPFRSDGITYGTPTWIWEVIVAGELYVRAYSGTQSRWYQAAIKQGAGQIHAAGKIWDVAFQSIDPERPVQEQIDEAYKRKYLNSNYLSAMIGHGHRHATIKITPLAK